MSPSSEKIDDRLLQLPATGVFGCVPIAYDHNRFATPFTTTSPWPGTYRKAVAIHA